MPWYKSVKMTKSVCITHRTSMLRRARLVDFGFCQPFLPAFDPFNKAVNVAKFKDLGRQTLAVERRQVQHPNLASSTYGLITSLEHLWLLDPTFLCRTQAHNPTADLRIFLLVEVELRKD